MHAIGADEDPVSKTARIERAHIVVLIALRVVNDPRLAVADDVAFGIIDMQAVREDRRPRIHRSGPMKTLTDGTSIRLPAMCFIRLRLGDMNMDPRLEPAGQIDRLFQQLIRNRERSMQPDEPVMLLQMPRRLRQSRLARCIAVTIRKLITQPPGANPWPLDCGDGRGRGRRTARFRS